MKIWNGIYQTRDKRKVYITSTNGVGTYPALGNWESGMPDKWTLSGFYLTREQNPEDLVKRLGPLK